MDKLSNLIKKADLVGVEIKQTLKDDSRVKSVIGGLLSMIIISTALFGFIYYSLTILRREEPIMNVVQSLESQAIIQTKNNPFAILITDRIGRPIHHTPGLQRAIQIDVELQQARPDPESGYKVSVFNGKMKPCDSTEISEKVFKEVTEAGYPIGLGLCHDSSSFVDSEGNPYTEELYLKNRHAQIDSNFIQYKVRKCDEKQDPECMNSTVPLSDITVIFYKLNYYIDQEDFESPVKVDAAQQAYFMSESLSQFVVVPTEINKIVTDKSLFLKDEVSETYYSMGQSSTSLKAYNDSSRILLEFAISVEKLVSINRRRYLKIPELLANLGGFVKTAFLISSLLCKTYSEFILFQNILEIEKNYVKRCIRPSSSFYSATELNPTTSKVKPNRKLKEKIPFWAYIFSFFGKKRKESIGKEKIFSYLGIEYAISNFLYLEDLKRERENNFIEGQN